MLPAIFLHEMTPGEGQMDTRQMWKLSHCQGALINLLPFCGFGGSRIGGEGKGPGVEITGSEMHPCLIKTPDKELLSLEVAGSRNADMPMAGLHEPRTAIPSRSLQSTSCAPSWCGKGGFPK